MAMMAAQEAVVGLLRREGVEYVFGIPGATELLFVDARGDLQRALKAASDSGEPHVVEVFVENRP